MKKRIKSILFLVFITFAFGIHSATSEELECGRYPFVTTEDYSKIRGGVTRTVRLRSYPEWENNYYDLDEIVNQTLSNYDSNSSYSENIDSHTGAVNYWMHTEYEWPYGYGYGIINHHVGWTTINLDEPNINFGDGQLLPDNYSILGLTVQLSTYSTGGTVEVIATSELNDFEGSAEEKWNAHQNASGLTLYSGPPLESRKCIYFTAEEVGSRRFKVIVRSPTHPKDLVPVKVIYDTGFGTSSAKAESTLFIQGPFSTRVLAGPDNPTSILPKLTPEEEEKAKHDAQLAVDRNQDGNIDFYGEDITKDDRRFVFWINNDNDFGNDVKAAEKNSTGKIEKENGKIVTRKKYEKIDSEDEKIDSVRDLEDFTRLHIRLNKEGDNGGPSLKDNLMSGAASMTITLTEEGEGNPSIRLWPAIEDVSGGAAYLTRRSVGVSQKSLKPFGKVESESSYTFDPEFWSEIDEDKGYFIFEAVGKGKATLKLELFENNENKVVDELYIDLKDIKEMYQHFSSGDFIKHKKDTVAATGLSTVPQEINGVSKEDLDKLGLDEKVIVFVHGWRMPQWDRRVFAETAFKRLYLQGYKGRFVFYSWPTDYVPIYQLIVGDKLIGDIHNYNRSEERARYASEPLLRLLKDLRDDYGYENLNMFAHSMGNIVASEALRNHAKDLPDVVGDERYDFLLSTYVASQAASVAHAYDRVNPTTKFPNLAVAKTPDVYSQYPIDDGEGYNEYYYRLDRVTTKLVNYYNETDAATTFPWDANVILKQQGLRSGFKRWYHNIFTENWIFSRIPFRLKKLFFPDDRYTILARIAVPRSKAAGADGKTMGVFDEKLDLNSNPYKFEDGHSAQFNGINATTNEYYDSLLKTFELLE